MWVQHNYTKRLYLPSYNSISIPQYYCSTVDQPTTNIMVLVVWLIHIEPFTIDIWLSMNIHKDPVTPMYIRRKLGEKKNLVGDSNISTYSNSCETIIFQFHILGISTEDRSALSIKSPGLYFIHILKWVDIFTLICDRGER